MPSVTRRRLLTAAGGVVGLSAAAAVAGPAAPAAPAPAPAGTKDRSFTNQSTIAVTYGAVQLSKGVVPAAGRVWEVQRVFWNVNFDGNVANSVQTYLYRLPSSLTNAQALSHMASSLEGWLGCCGNSELTGNGDMQFDANEVVVRPGQMLWIAFITSADNNNFVMAAGMSVWEQAE